MSSSPWERSSFFSSVLARELRLLWAPMYRVAYTGLVKLVGCRAKKITRLGARCPKCTHLQETSPEDDVKHLPVPQNRHLSNSHWCPMY
ncbi:hypothetical protein EYF80_007323 [Liparis tanakae]|uniref:Uncharacterized protein n=1 Tax=Liparis tanakae TaxID=230148 RepID=A0A4Z2IYB7_9TELE|nr:hypothetical protein EYF80_007323 [Liparis tanakae]